MFVVLIVCAPMNASPANISWALAMYQGQPHIFCKAAISATTGCLLPVPIVDPSILIEKEVGRLSNLANTRGQTSKGNCFGFALER